MTPDPLLSADREREALRALSDAATPGEWVRQTVGNASVEQLGHKLLHDLLVPLPDGIPPHTDATYLLTEDGSKTVAFIGNGPRQTENGDFIVAAVNYVRAALATPPAAALSSPETTPAGVLDEAALLDAALTTAILAMAGIPCGEPHDSDLRYAFGPDGSFAADLRAALRGSGRE